MEDYDKYMILQEQLSRNELILRRIAGGAGNLSRVCEVCLQPWPGQAVFEGKKEYQQANLTVRFAARRLS